MSEDQNQNSPIDKVKCPYCGYEMPIFVKPPAVCRGLFVRCKGRHCKMEFEIRVPSQVAGKKRFELKVEI